MYACRSIHPRREQRNSERNGHVSRKERPTLDYLVIKATFRDWTDMLLRKILCATDFICKTSNLIEINLVVKITMLMNTILSIK